MVTIFPLACPTLPGDEAIAAPLISAAQSVLATKVATAPLPPSFYVVATGATPGALALVHGALAAPGGEGGTAAHAWATTHKTAPWKRIYFNSGEGFPDPVVPQSADHEADEIAAELHRVEINLALLALPAGASYVHSFAGASAGTVVRVLASGRTRGWNSCLYYTSPSPRARGGSRLRSSV